MADQEELPSPVVEMMTERMRADLRTAMKARDTVTVAVLRSALAAIANADATSDSAAADRASPVSSEHVAGAAAGLGAAEVERRLLTAADVQAVLEREVGERLTAAEQLERAGRADDAERLRREAEALAPYRDPGERPPLG